MDGDNRASWEEHRLCFNTVLTCPWWLPNPGVQGHSFIIIHGWLILLLAQTPGTHEFGTHVSIKNGSEGPTFQEKNGFLLWRAVIALLSHYQYLHLQSSLLSFFFTYEISTDFSKPVSTRSDATMLSLHTELHLLSLSSICHLIWLTKFHAFFPKLSLNILH